MNVIKNDICWYAYIHIHIHIRDEQGRFMAFKTLDSGMHMCVPMYVYIYIYIYIYIHTYIGIHTNRSDTL